MSDAFWDQSQFEIVKQVINLEGEVATGEVVQKSSSLKEDDYPILEQLSIPSSVPKNILNNRYRKVFVDPIDREREGLDTISTDYFNALDKDVTLTGINRDAFLAAVAREGLTYDFCYVVMDDVSADKKSSNVVDNVSNRAFPFFTIVVPQAVNEEYTFYDENDNLTQFAWDYTIKIDNVDTTRTKVIKKDSIEIMEGTESVSTTPITSSKYNYNLWVKIVRFEEDTQNSKLLDSTPSMWASCKAVLNIMTLDAGLDYSLFKNSFAQFVYACSKELLTRILDAKEPFKLGDKGTLFEDSDQSNVSRFMQPATGNSDAISNRKKDKYEQIYREEGMKFSQGGSAQSADSKLMDQTENNSNLKYVARIIASVDKWMDTMFALHLSLKFDADTTKYGYPKDFGLKDIEEQLDNLATFLNEGGASIDVARKESLKEMARSLFQGDVLEKVNEAIDESTDGDESGNINETF